MLSVSVQGQNPSETGPVRLPPTRPQSGSFSAISGATDDCCPGSCRFLLGRIGRAVIHHYDIGQMAPNAVNDPGNPPGFIETRYQRGTLPFPIDHIAILRIPSDLAICKSCAIS
jgi:hypothetical protein